MAVAICLSLWQHMPMRRTLLMDDFSERPFDTRLCEDTKPDAVARTLSGDGDFLSLPMKRLQVSNFDLQQPFESGLSVAHSLRRTPPDLLRTANGHLIPSAGNHRLMDLMTGQTLPPPGSGKQFFDNIAQRAKWCRTRGIGFHTWIFPDKMVALRHLLDNGDRIRSLWQSHYAVSRHFRDDFPIHYLIDRVDGDDDAYNRHDTHFSAAVMTDVVCRMAAASLGIDDPAWRERIWQAHIYQPDWVFEMGRLFSPCLRENIWKLEPGPGATLAENGIQTGNDGIMILGEFPASATDKTLLIFGDSFFRQLLDYLGVFFRRVIFCRTRFFHIEIARAVKADVIFNGLAERYLSAVQPDALRPHFLAYPYKTGRRVAPSDKFARMWKSFVNSRATALSAPPPARQDENGPDDL